VERQHQSDLQNLRLRDQLRFLVYLYCLKLEELSYRFRSHRARAHWIGSHDRPRRFERALFIVVVFVAMITFDAHQYIIWGLAWGGGASLFVIVESFVILFSRKTSSQMNSELQ
jgi:hypothetical protein